MGQTDTEEERRASGWSIDPWELKTVSDLLEFRLLKYLVAIAETANFTRASERLFLAQPTLSQQIIALEDGIGVQIFNRRREGVSLTPAGQMLYTFAQDALALRSEVVKAARAMDRGEVPPLRVGFSALSIQTWCKVSGRSTPAYSLKAPCK